MGKKKNGNRKKNGNGFTNDFGGINPENFEDLGSGFNGRFKNIGMGFIESVDAGRQPTINFAEGGRSKQAVSPLFSSDFGQGFGDFGGFKKLTTAAEGKKRKKGKKKKTKKEEVEEKRETLGGFIARKISERKKSSQFSKEDLKSEKEADRRTQEKLRRLIEEEKERRSHERDEADKQ